MRRWELGGNKASEVASRQQRACVLPYKFTDRVQFWPTFCNSDPERADEGKDDSSSNQNDAAVGGTIFIASMVAIALFPFP